jgi:hypothetical protein
MWNLRCFPIAVAAAQRRPGWLEPLSEAKLSGAKLSEAKQGQKTERQPEPKQRFELYARQTPIEPCLGGHA